MDVGLPGPVARRLRERLPRLRPAEELSALGVDCVVAAVSKVPRSAADLSSKNDRNDAARMAKAILSHDVTPVWVPSPRSRGSGTSPPPTTRRPRGSRRRSSGSWRSWPAGATPTAATPAGNPGGTGRTASSGGSTATPADDGGIRALAALRSEVEAADETREALLAEYRAAVAAGPLSAEVEALQSIEGCGFALAAAFASEVGDFSRFRSGRQVTSYFGLAPKQRSSADSVRLGGIGGAGNALVRRLAVEGPGATPRRATNRS